MIAPGSHRLSLSQSSQDPDCAAAGAALAGAGGTIAGVGGGGTSAAGFTAAGGALAFCAVVGAGGTGAAGGFVPPAAPTAGFGATTAGALVRGGIADGATAVAGAVAAGAVFAAWASLRCSSAEFAVADIEQPARFAQLRFEILDAVLEGERFGIARAGGAAAGPGTAAGSESRAASVRPPRRRRGHARRSSGA